MVVELLIIVFLIVLIVFANNRIPKGMPPGESGWPIIGFIPSPKVPITKTLKQLERKHGKIFTIFMGSQTFVYICDFKTIKSAFNNSSLIDRPSMFSLELYSKYGLGSINGVQYQNLRRFVLSHLADNGMRKSSLEDLISYEAEELVKNFQKHVDRVIEIIPFAITLAPLNVIWKIMSGKRYEDGEEAVRLYEENLSHIIDDVQSVPFAMFTIFPKADKFIPNKLKGYLGISDGLKRASKFLDFLKTYITEHKKNLDEDNPKDFIDFYLLAIKEQTKLGSPYTFSELELLYTLSDFFGAGSATMTSALEWVIAFMVKYPEVQSKNQELIDDIVPRDRLPGLQDKEKLAYLEATIFETMRMKTVAPIGVPHLAKADTQLGNFRIPKGAMVTAALDFCHYDSDYWDKPHEFQPERFLLPDGSVDGKKDGFLPYSIGRRACIGEPMARMEMFLFTAALLQKYTFSSPDGTDAVDMNPEPVLKLCQRPKRFKMIVKERY